jgi:hypothetical protein
MLLEPQRMNTYEPFSIGKPFDKIKDIGKDVGGKVVDTGKDIGGKVVDTGKDIGGKVADVGKKVGGTLVAFGQGVGKILGPAFKKLLGFLMMIFKNWKIALSIAVTCCVCYLAMPFITPVLTFFK